VNGWRRWIEQPQNVFLRRLLFQIHLWTGLAVGLYVFVIFLSGSVLVYRNELYRTFSPQPVLVRSVGALLSDDALSEAARRAYPGYSVDDLRKGQAPNEAVAITLLRGDETIARLFDPFTAEDLGDPVPAGYKFTSWLLDFHDNLLGGDTGRQVNGIGAVMVLVLCVTGAVIWWPGYRNWRRSLTVNLRPGAKRVTWRLHSALGFWLFIFVVLWGITGAYLSFPSAMTAFFDAIQPYDAANPAERTVDRIQSWLAYLHFGRLGGRRIPWCGRGLCDSITKATWATAGLVGPAMFVTGALMWWNRVVRPAYRRATRGQRAARAV
jgi:uncharacterized iron-regulated membrane protein